MNIQKAVRSEQFLRISIGAPAGSGKTFSALRVGTALAEGGQVGMVDSENGSGALYAGEENPDGGVFDFYHADLANEPGKFSAENYMKAIREMAKLGVRVLIIDSLSHAWAGEGGILEFADAQAARSSGNKFAAWKTATPMHNRLLQSILSYPGHVIATMRTKVEFVQEGKNIRKVGMQPVQREGVDYEFSVCGDMDPEAHRLVISKTRISALTDRSFVKPGADLAAPMLQWLRSAKEPRPVVLRPVVSGPSREEMSEEALTQFLVDNEHLEDEMARKRGEVDPDADPSWYANDDAGMREFFGRMGALGYRDYEEVKRFCASLGRPVPKKMSAKQRTAMIDFLGSSAGADRYATFLRADANRSVADPTVEIE